MPDKDTLATAQFRIAQARRSLRDAERTMVIDAFGCSVNRSYYAIFYAMRALLALVGFDAQRHDSTISEFRRRFVKTGLLPVECSKIVGDAFIVRLESDYQDFYAVTRNKVAEQLENAKIFLTVVEEYLSRAAPEALTVNVDFDDDESC